MISSSAKIHPSSIVESGATLGDNVIIGPFCYIGSNVSIGDRTVLKSHVVINGHTTIGQDNEIYQFSSIGEVNQDLKYKGEPTFTIIGDRNRIRESVTIHRGTIQGENQTVVGNDNLFMINAHIAHDCIIGSHCILANNATLAGHVQLGEFVIIGGMTAVHQFCVIGDHVMVGGCSGVAQDVPPYIIAQGNHATPHGLNLHGLKRRGFNRDTINIIRDCYNALYRDNLSYDEAKIAIKKMTTDMPEGTTFSSFFERTTRGIIR